MIPKLDDYVRGSFRRSFSKRRNSEFFYESTGTTPDPEVWDTVTVDWKLIGPIASKKSSDVTIASENTKAIQRVKKKIPNITKILKNPFTYTLLWPFISDEILQGLRNRNLISRKQFNLTLERNEKTIRSIAEERILRPPFEISQI